MGGELQMRRKLELIRAAASESHTAALKLTKYAKTLENELKRNAGKLQCMVAHSVLTGYSRGASGYHRSRPRRICFQQQRAMGRALC